MMRRRAASAPAALVVRAAARANTCGGISQALANLDRAIALDDKNGSAFRLRGDMTRAAGGNLSGAEADQGDRARSQRRGGLRASGLVHTNQRKFDDAIADYDQAIRLKPDDARACSDRSRDLLSRRRL